MSSYQGSLTVTEGCCGVISRIDVRKFENDFVSTSTTTGANSVIRLDMMRQSRIFQFVPYIDLFIVEPDFREQ